jgi:hypothetical protein
VPSLVRQASLALASNGSATLASPQTMRPSSSPSATRVEMDALVPDRIPDAVGDGLDVAVAVVEEDDVQIAVGAQRATAVPAHCDQSHVTPGVSGDPVSEAREPGVSFGGVAPAERLALELGLGHQPGAALPQGWRGALGR